MRLSILLFLVFDLVNAAYAEGFQCKVNGEIQGESFNYNLNYEDFRTKDTDDDGDEYFDNGTHYLTWFKNYAFTISYSDFAISKNIGDFEEIEEYIIAISNTVTGTLSLLDGDGWVNFDCSKNN